MAKPGRPPKHGVQPGWMFHRSAAALYGYNQARSAGQKHSTAVAEAVKTVRSVLPGMPISETEVKRILAEYQPKDGVAALTVREGSGACIEVPPEVCRLLGIPEGKRLRGIYSFGYGRKPEYSRHNARSVKTSSSKLQDDPPGQF